MQVIVEVEDQIHTYEPADNGAGPLWCHGSTVVARHGDAVYVAGLETVPDEVPLNNTRWVLFRRANDGDWELVHRDDSGRTREPSPIALLASGELLVSANPTLAPSGEYGGAARPAVFRFRADDPEAEPRVELPVWDGETAFRDHSYRTVTADGERGQVLYMQNEGYAFAHMSLWSDDRWHGRGKITWPYGAEYPKPQPLRLCYPNVMLRRGTAHFLGVGDITEPVADWRAAKKQITGRDWDYVFRRLFYAATPDVAAEPFGDWLELANRDATAGATRNCDLWVDGDGAAHVLWVDVTTDDRIRDQFFSGVALRTALEYAVIRDGRVASQRTLAAHDEGEDGLVPQLARVHETADGRAVLLAQFNDSSGGVVYRITPLAETEPEWTDVPFERPMGGTILTSTVRGGSAPSDTIDVVGVVRGPALGYTRLRLGA